jgi:hypothetical protein
MVIIRTATLSMLDDDETDNDNKGISACVEEWWQITMRMIVDDGKNDDRTEVNVRSAWRCEW